MIETTLYPFALAPLVPAPALFLAGPDMPFASGQPHVTATRMPVASGPPPIVVLPAKKSNRLEQVIVTTLY